MTLTEDQAKNAKEQIIKHIESTFPEDKKREAIDYLNSLDNEKLEEFLVKNNMIKSEEPSKEGSIQKVNKTNCVYCLIAQKQIESLPLYEDEDYIAVLEINPFSKGHTIIIPKQHIEESKKIPAKALTLAKKIGNHIIKKIKAEDFQINTADDMKHVIVNIVPTYKGQELKYERKKAKPEELKELAMIIGKLEIKTQSKPAEQKVEEARPAEPKPEPKVEKPSNVIKMNRRIP